MIAAHAGRKQTCGHHTGWGGGASSGSSQGDKVTFQANRDAPSRRRRHTGASQATQQLTSTTVCMNGLACARVRSLGAVSRAGHVQPFIWIKLCIPQPSPHELHNKPPRTVMSFAFPPKWNQMFPVQTFHYCHMAKKNLISRKSFCFLCTLSNHILKGKDKPKRAKGLTLTI